uniref:Solute carrier family 25 member 43 n=1 Tax=Coturnix japonica TaxID=93934 RepID=A0A8C2YG05_COTJA
MGTKIVTFAHSALSHYFWTSFKRLCPIQTFYLLPPHRTAGVDLRGHRRGRPLFCSAAPGLFRSALQPGPGRARPASPPHGWFTVRGHGHLAAGRAAERPAAAVLCGAGGRNEPQPDGAAGAGAGAEADGHRHCGRGLLGAGRGLCRTEGVRALWKGNLTACLRLCPYSALQIAASRRLVILFTDELGHISHWRAIIAGSLAGMVATVVTYPTDVIKTRLIVQNRLEPSYEGILHAFYKIYHQEGLVALYRGVTPAILGAVPFSAGSFFVYISLDKIWREPMVCFTPLQNFINGCVAAAVAQTLSFPFETVKRKMQRFKRRRVRGSLTVVQWTSISQAWLTVFGRP